MSDGRAAFLRAPEAGEWIMTLSEPNGRIFRRDLVPADFAGQTVRIAPPAGKACVIRYEWRRTARGDGSL